MSYTQRLEYVKKNITHIKYENLKLISLDIKSLSGVSILKNNLFTAKNNYFTLKDTLGFVCLVDSLIKNTNLLFYLCKSNAKIISNNVITDSNERYLKSYLINNINCRVKFLEEHYEEIETFQLQLIQSDIDKLLNVKTKYYLRRGKLDVKRLKKAISVWQSRIFKINSK